MPSSQSPIPEEAHGGSAELPAERFRQHPDSDASTTRLPRDEWAGGLTVDQRDDLADFRRRRRIAGRWPVQGVKRMGFRVGDCGTYQLFFAAGEYFGVEGHEQDQ